MVTTAVSPQRQQEQVAKTFLQNILVLAAGQVVEQKDNKPVTVNTVTLAVTPDESEKLALASNDGKIQLVMRNFADAGKVETPGSDKGGLLSSMRPKAPVVAAKKTVASKAVYRKASAPAPAAPLRVVKSGYVVEVIKGGKRSEETFQ